MITGAAADGKVLSQDEIVLLTQELSQKAEALYREIRGLSFEDLKQLVMMQECYQLRRLFDAVGMDWRPTGEMKERVVNQPLLEGLLPRGVMMTDVEAFKQTFGIEGFEREVLGA
jgi:hypothetical protein